MASAVFVALIAVRDYDSAKRFYVPGFFQNVDRAHRVGGKGLHRVEDRPLGGNLGGVVNDNLGLGSGEDIGQSFAVAEVAENRSHAAIEQRGIEEVWTG